MIATFLFTIYQFARDRRERKFTAIDVILKSRREMLSHNLTEENVRRFRAEDIDLEKSPITIHEGDLVLSAINHFNLVFVAYKAGLYKMDQGDRQDIASFLRLTIPNQVWQEVKKYYKEEFADFVDGVIQGDIRVKGM